MAVDFPANPSAGDEFTANGVTYRFDGGAWVLSFAPSPANPNYVQTTGGIMTGPLQLHGDAVNPLDAVPLKMLSNAILFNGSPAGGAFIEVDIHAYKLVEVFIQGLRPVSGSPNLGMIFNVENVWYNSVNNYRTNGWSQVAAVFNGTIGNSTLNYVPLSGAFSATTDILPVVKATIFNGNTHSTARVKTEDHGATASGHGQRDYWSMPQAAAMQKRKITAFRLIWIGGQEFHPDGDLIVRGVV